MRDIGEDVDIADVAAASVLDGLAGLRVVHRPRWRRGLAFFGLVAAACTGDDDTASEPSETPVVAPKKIVSRS